MFSKDELDQLMGAFNYAAIARPKAGISREAALAELNLVAARFEKM